jgi:L-ascorbate metabolism protein UlaG (beta-lactamase superfamily)
MKMKLKWYGHASFRITSSQGISIVTDPYTPELAGYPPVIEPADMVIVSSDNDDYHCRYDLIPGDPVVVNALEVAVNGGERQELGVLIRAIQSMEMEDHPYHAPDQNGMYRLVVDGLHIGHMGDVGNPLTEAQIDFFKGLDILLALAGDTPTIRLDDMKTAIDTTHPKIVVPMHFRTLTYKPRNTLWIQSFLSYFDDDQIDFACAFEVNLVKSDLPASTRIMVLDYMR